MQREQHGQRGKAVALGGVHVPPTVVCQGIEGRGQPADAPSPTITAPTAPANHRHQLPAGIEYPQASGDLPTSHVLRAWIPSTPGAF